LKSEQPVPTGQIIAIQAALAVLCWGLLGLLAARKAWLFDPYQIAFALRFFVLQLPPLGALGAVILPGLLYERLRVEAEDPGILDREFLVRVFAFPRRAAVFSLLISVFVFTLGATELRLFAHSATEESAKMFILGLVTGLLFATLSYLVLSERVRPLAAVALQRGALPPKEPILSIGRKVFLCSLALSVVPLGLFAPSSLTWAQRSGEVQTTIRAQDELGAVVAEAGRRSPSTPAGWSNFLRSHLGGFEELVAANPAGAPLAAISRSGKPSGFFDRAENLDYLSIRQPGAFASRRDNNLLVVVDRIPSGYRLYASLWPDRTPEWMLFQQAIKMGLAVVGLAILVSWIAGRVIAGPIVELEASTRRYAADPEKGSVTMIASDDETGALSEAFSEMARSVGDMRERLKQTQRVAGAVESIASLAHQIRNPIFGITTTVASLETELRDDPRFGKHLEVVTKESHRLSRIIDDMLSLRTRPPGKLEASSVEAAVEEARAWLPSRFPGRTVVVTMSSEPGVPLVMLDMERMIQVFSNLFENSVLMSEDPARIDVSIARREGAVVVEVCDSGSGIPVEEAARIFEPLYSGRPGGTGLGLSICRDILAAHGGTIEFVVGGPGARFRLSLPGSPAGAPE
jgi:signal transduction histidine kinase